MDAEASAADVVADTLTDATGSWTILPLRPGLRPRLMCRWQVKPAGRQPWAAWERKHQPPSGPGCRYDRLYPWGSTTAAAAAIVVCGLSGCAPHAGVMPPSAATPAPAPPVQLPQGTRYIVQPGDTLWHIAHAFGVRVEHLAATNRLTDEHRLTSGQSLFVPLSEETQHFLWPALGPHESLRENSLSIQVPRGTQVRASRSGLVVVAAQDVSGLGPTVIVDHLDGYFTAYAGMDQVFVSPGTEVVQGAPLGTMLARALQFEIRLGTVRQDARALLPKP